MATTSVRAEHLLITLKGKVVSLTEVTICAILPPLRQHVPHATHLTFILSALSF